MEEACSVRLRETLFDHAYNCLVAREFNSKACKAIWDLEGTLFV